jgi:hypothetical protein
MATVKKSAPKKRATLKKEVVKEVVRESMESELRFKGPGLDLPPNPLPYDVSTKSKHPIPYEGLKFERAPENGIGWDWEDKLKQQQRITDYDRDAALLESAMHDLKHLRKQNRQMYARLDMFDKMYELFITGNSNGAGMSCEQPLEDRIEKRLYEKAEERKVSK